MEKNRESSYVAIRLIIIHQYKPPFAIRFAHYSVGFIGCGAIAKVMARAAAEIAPFKGVAYSPPGGGAEEFAKEMEVRVGAIHLLRYLPPKLNNPSLCSPSLRSPLGRTRSSIHRC